MDFNLYNQNKLRVLLRVAAKVRESVKHLPTRVADWLLPRMCIRCNRQRAQERHPCCTDCYIKLPFQSHCCPQCGQNYSGTTDYCGRCIAAPPTFDACFCPFRYETVIKQQIIAFKYYERPELAESLAQLLFAEILANDIGFPQLLVPVPTHISKLRQRGYNQSLLLTKELSKLMQVPYKQNLLKKTRATTPQAELCLTQRHKNLHNCFEFIGKTTCKHVAIVDDVFTTGATALEISNVLKKNGVDYIQFLGIAHTI